jgi:hypothetical protein
MKHVVIRAKPVILPPPAVEKITLDVSPEELLGLYRAVARVQFDDYDRKADAFAGEAGGLKVPHLMDLFHNIRAAANAAGVVG